MTWKGVFFLVFCVWLLFRCAGSIAQEQGVYDNKCVMIYQYSLTESGTYHIRYRWSQTEESPLVWLELAQHVDKTPMDILEVSMSEGERVGAVGMFIEGKPEQNRIIPNVPRFVKGVVHTALVGDDFIFTAKECSDAKK